MVWRSDRARNLYNSIDRPNWSQEVIGGGLTSEESSESEFVEGEKPWPPTEERLSRARAQKMAPRVPRPHSHLFRTQGGHSRGSKHSRRWENSMFLSSLHPISEEEFEAASSILPSHHSPLSKLHNSDKCMQIWCSFSSQSEEQQEKLLPSHLVRNSKGARVICNHHPPPANSHSLLQDSPSGRCSPMGETLSSPEQRFWKVESRIQAILRHNRHLPLGTIAGIEEEISHLFSISSQAVVLVLQSNPFCRLLIHGIAQYLQLKSTTEHISDGSSVVVIDCERGGFIPPDISLSAYLSSKSRT